MVEANNTINNSLLRKKTIKMVSGMGKNIRKRVLERQDARFNGSDDGSRKDGSSDDGSVLKQMSSFTD